LSTCTSPDKLHTYFTGLLIKINPSILIKSMKRISHSHLQQEFYGACKGICG
jgi:hypothetical protein